MKQNGTPKSRPHQLEPVQLFGSLLGLKTAPLMVKLEPIATLFEDELELIVSGRFDHVQVATTMPRSAAEGWCGPWLAELPGDELRVEIGEKATTAWSADAALPAHAPALLQELGGELAQVGFDGEVWTYLVEHTHGTDADTEAVVEKIKHVGTAIGVTAPALNVGSGLMRSYARGMPSRAWLQTRGDVVQPRLGLQWDRVEWTPIQSMLRGFYPNIDGVGKINRMSKGVEVEEATVELVLGPTNPPAMRISIMIKSSPLRGI